MTYTVNVVNEVTALSDGTSFTYDDNGSRTQKAKGTDTWDYTHDYANRLTAVEENSETIGEYAYDGYGRRIQVTENSVTTTYIYSRLDVVYEATSTGTACYIYGPTGRLAKRTTVDEESSIFYYSGDHLGSTRLATDENGNIVVAIVYRPFGEVSTQEGTENYMFTGKELDETGLYYYGSRYYDPDLGRFITRDSLMGHVSTPQSLNRFAYCQNNPLKYVDPWGEYGALHDIGNPGDEYTQKVLNESSSSTSGDEGSDSDESNDDSSLPPGFDPNADYWDPKMMPEVIDAVNDQSKDTSDIGLPPGFDPNADYWDPNIMIKVVEAVLAVLGSNLTGVRGTPSPESDEEEDMLDVAVPGFVIICGVSVSVFGTCLFSADMVKGVALVAITGLAVGTLGVGLILGGFILSLYLLDKTANMER